MLANRTAVAERYNELLAGVAEIETQYVSPDVDMSWFVYVIRLADRFTADQRDSVLNTLRERGIGCSNYFPCIHLEPYYSTGFGYGKGDFPVAESISDRSIALPFFGRMTVEQSVRVVDELKQAVADAALEYIRPRLEDDTVLGIGTGSTVAAAGTADAPLPDTSAISR